MTNPPPPQPANLLAALPDAHAAEVFTALLERPGFRLERIVSHGQATPADEPMIQDRDEWVLLVAGGAGLRIDDQPEIALAPGDHLLIEAGKRHWVTWTRGDMPTVWLALHVD
jgi:cupin 2 domain-containing protein